MLDRQLDNQLLEIRALMQERLRIRGKSLQAQLRKAGRLLPRGVRRDATFLIEARGQVQNPKLARMIDQKRLNDAHRNIVSYLGTIDPAERRKDRILGILGVFAFNFLLIGGGFVTWLVWTGRV